MKRFCQQGRSLWLLPQNDYYSRKENSMLSVIVGLVFSVAGIWGVVQWWPQLIVVFKGLVPFMLCIGGCISMVAGITAIRDNMEDAKEKTKEKENAKAEQK